MKMKKKHFDIRRGGSILLGRRSIAPQDVGRRNDIRHGNRLCSRSSLNFNPANRWPPIRAPTGDEAPRGTGFP